MLKNYKNYKVEKARNYAIFLHGEQKFGEEPYYYHLDMVHDIVVEFGLDEEYEIAAYLHDLLEDTSITKQELIKEFGEDIADMVFCVSGFGKNRKEKQKNIYEKIQTNVKSINLKMCDRLANLRSSKLNKPKLFKRYCEEHELFNLDLIFSKGDLNLFKAIKFELTIQPKFEEKKLFIK
jgi:(p)ppGpp synthase/HD superfamily hydrolase